MLTGTELFSLSWLFNGSTVNIFNITFKICYIENLRSGWYYHSHKKRKDEITAVLLICELKIYGVVLQRIHQNSKKWWLLWGITQLKWLWDCFSHFLLLWLCCQRFRDSSEDHYRSKRLSQMLLVRYSFLNSQNISINNSEKRLVTYLLGQLRRS